MPELGRTPKPKKNTPAELEKKRLSAALMKISERSLSVDPRDVDSYVPREADIQIAEAMLAGAITFSQIAERLQVTSSWVGQHMKDPLVCAWVSRTIHRNIQHRLGQVDAAMLQRAMAGDVRAADLLYKRYGQMTKRSFNVSAQLDLSKLPDQDLEALIQDAQKSRVIEVPRSKDQAADGS